MADQNPKYDFPTELMEEIRCSYCNNYVSCGPIKVNLDGGTVCGRCSSSSGDGAVRHIQYEMILSKFNFPCRYKAQGCEKQFSFGDVEHESACPYRTFACPVLPRDYCTKHLSVFDIYEHFEDTHGSLIVKDGRFKLDLQADSRCNLLFRKDGQIVAVQYAYDAMKEMLYLNVAYFSDSNQGLSYKLQIESGMDSDRSINFKNHQCDRYECQIINQECCRSFAMGNYLPALENPCFVFVNVTLESSASGSENQAELCVSIEKLSLVNTEQKTLDAWSALENIRCSICHCISIPPLYKNGGYIYCHECKVKSNIKAVEHALTVANFPCQWRGCTFVGNETNIKDHVGKCQHRTVICPLPSCQKGYYAPNAAIKHIQGHGAKYCPDPERIIVELFLTGQDSACREYVTTFENTLIAFICNIQKINYAYVWQLEIGNNLKGKFTLEIYFEHEHCSFKSKTYIIKVSRGNYILCKNRNYEENLPQCFNFCKTMWAVLKIKQN